MSEIEGFDPSYIQETDFSLFPLYKDYKELDFLKK